MSEYALQYLAVLPPWRNNRWRTWVRIQMDSGRRFLGDALWEQRSLHWGSEVTLRALERKWNETGCCWEVKSHHFPFFPPREVDLTNNASQRTRLTVHVCGPDGHRWCTQQEFEYLSSKEAQTLNPGDMSTHRMGSGGLGSLEFQVKIWIWCLLAVICSLRGVYILRGPGRELDVPKVNTLSSRKLMGGCHISLPVPLSLINTDRPCQLQRLQHLLARQPPHTAASLILGCDFRKGSGHIAQSYLEVSSPPVPSPASSRSRPTSLLESLTLLPPTLQTQHQKQCKYHGLEEEFTMETPAWAQPSPARWSWAYRI